MTWWLLASLWLTFAPQAPQGPLTRSLERYRLITQGWAQTTPYGAQKEAKHGQSKARRRVPQARRSRGVARINVNQRRRRIAPLTSNRFVGTASDHNERGSTYLIGVASHYGEPYRGTHYVAVPRMWRGKRIYVTNVATGKRIGPLKVNDYGPDPKVHPDRVVDLAPEFFEQLCPTSKGLFRAKVELADGR